MKQEYICVVTLDGRDLRLVAAGNGYGRIDHPIPVIQTILKLAPEVQQRLVQEQPAEKEDA